MEELEEQLRVWNFELNGSSFESSVLMTKTPLTGTDLMRR
jgi:hypothetical protein